MPVRIDAKKAKLSDPTKEYIEKACEKFSQFYDRIVDVLVIVDTQKKHKHTNSVEVIVKVPGQRLVGKGETDDPNLFKAIDETASHMERQLKKCHDKKLERRKPIDFSAD